MMNEEDSRLSGNGFPERKSSQPMGGFVPLTSRLNTPAPRKKTDALSAHAIRGRLKDRGLAEGGQGVLTDLVEELNDSISPQDGYSMRSVLRTIHHDLATGKQAIDLDGVKAQATQAFERLKSTLPE